MTCSSNTLVIKINGERVIEINGESANQFLFFFAVTMLDKKV